MSHAASDGSVGRLGDHDHRSGVQDQYGSDPRGYPPPFPANLEPGGLLVRFFARLIDGIIVGIVSFLLFFFTDTLSNTG